MDENELRRLIGRTRLAPSAESLLGLARPAIHLRRQLLEDSDLGVGVSKLGGKPDLPPDFVWPSHGGIPLAFLAQLRFEELAPHDPEGVLPTRGLLSIFLGLAPQPSGLDFEERGRWVVAYHRAVPSDLARRDPPEEWLSFARTLAPFWNSGVLQSCSVGPVPALTLPDPHAPEAEPFVAVSGRGYRSLVASTRAGLGPLHQVLGWPIIVQGPVAEVCRSATGGMPVQDRGESLPKMDEATYQNADEWRLLLQVDTDKAAGYEWGDNATLFFMIRPTDLRSARFGNVWHVYQSH